MTRRKQAPPPPHGTGKFGEAASVIYLVTHLGDTLMYGAFALLFKLLGKFWRFWTVLAAAGFVWVWVGSWIPAVLVLAAYVAFRLRRKRPKPEPEVDWWSHAALQDALIQAKILQAPAPAPPETDKKGRPLTDKQGKLLPARPTLMLSYRGQPVHAEAGTTVTVGLPQAKTLADVVARRESFASALRVPAKWVEVHQDSDDPANAVRIFVANGTPAAVRPAAVASAESTDWSQPIVLGPDERSGREAVFETTQTHSVLTGATGSGKTDTAHLIISYAALDVRVRIFGIDGKGDAGAKGWEPLEPCCEAFVRGMGPDSPRRVEALLRTVYDLAEQRGAAGDEAPEVVLILEEWATARAVLHRLDPKAADRCDALVTVLLATARSRGVHVLLIVQRGTKESFPTDQRANCGQRLVGKFGDSAEARYVLETLPPRLPERAGEFALSLDGRPAALVAVDHLDNAAWVAVCRRAAKLRAAGGVAPSGPVVERPALAVVRSDRPATDAGLIGEVVAHLSEADRPLSATELHRLLSPEKQAACPTAHRLGILLAGSDLVRRVPLGNARAWTLTAAGAASGSSASVL